MNLSSSGVKRVCAEATEINKAGDTDNDRMAKRKEEERKNRKDCVLQLGFILYAPVEIFGRDDSIFNPDSAF